MPTRDQPEVPAALAVAIARVPLPRSEVPFRRHLDSLTKPPGSLGQLEDIAARLHALGIPALRKAAFLFAADHGLAAEGVSAYPPEVTRQMVVNFLAGGAAINVLARLNGATVHIVNAGVAANLPDHPQLRNTPVRAGSRNMLREAALSPSELIMALELGLQAAVEAHHLGYTLVAAGEMGIGNTSSAAAIAAALTGRDLAEVAGRGTGLDDRAYAHKVATLRAVLALHQPAGALDTLRRVGGTEIAGLTGFLIGCASHGIAIVIDGFIATAAAATALALAPALHPWLFAGHQSAEPGHRILLEHVRLRPILQLDMRLGEGSGAVLAMPIFAAALALYAEMATFSSAAVSGPTEQPSKP